MIVVCSEQLVLFDCVELYCKWYYKVDIEIGLFVRGGDPDVIDSIVPNFFTLGDDAIYGRLVIPLKDFLP